MWGLGIAHVVGASRGKQGLARPGPGKALGTRHGVGPPWERGPLARIRAARRGPGDAGQRPALPGLFPEVVDLTALTVGGKRRA